MQVQTNELREMLARGPMTFIFEKKNGGVRRMTATTSKDWTPDHKEVIQNSDKVITVYDLEKKDYRCVSADAFVVM